MSTTVKNGDTVTVHYTGRRPDGSVFETSGNRGPLKLVLGERRVIPGFEKAIVGMSAGESKTATIPAAEAYGERRPEMVVQFDRGKIPPDINVEIGQQLHLQTTNGESIPARVVDTSGTDVTLDANHPLAGQDLTFDIELVEIAAAG